jgi:hypothetical protein
MPRNLVDWGRGQCTDITLCSHLTNMKREGAHVGYNSEGCGFETRWGDILNLPNPSGRTRFWDLLSP